VCAALCLLAGCGPAHEEADLLPLIARVDAGECAVVEPHLRAHLVARPDSAVGHYLLARCLHAARPLYFTLAQGEYRTALFLARRRANLDAFAEVFPDRRLEEAVHAGLAALHLAWADAGAGNGAPPAFLRDHLKQVRYHVDEIAALPGADAARLEALRRDLARRETLLRGPASGPIV
jgi:hypothetical protein